MRRRRSFKVRCGALQVFAGGENARGRDEIFRWDKDGPGTATSAGRRRID